MIVSTITESPYLVVLLFGRVLEGVVKFESGLLPGFPSFVCVPFVVKECHQFGQQCSFTLIISYFDHAVARADNDNGRASYILGVFLEI